MYIALFPFSRMIPVTYYSLKQQMHAQLLSRVGLFATPRTVAHQAPLSMEFSRQEYWNALSFPSPGDPLDPGIKPRSPALQADSLPSEPPGKPIHKNKRPKCKTGNHRTFTKKHR